LKLAAHPCTLKLLYSMPAAAYAATLSTFRHEICIQYHRLTLPQLTAKSSLSCSLHHDRFAVPPTLRQMTSCSTPPVSLIPPHILPQCSIWTHSFDWCRRTICFRHLAYLLVHFRGVIASSIGVAYRLSFRLQDLY